MSMRNVTILAATGAVFAFAGFAQQEGKDLAPRQAADLTETLEDTSERAPKTVPDSSAMDVAEIDPAAFRFGIGQPASEAEIAAIDIDVMPDGRGAPEGSGTFAEGEELYAIQCVACHGEDGSGLQEFGAPNLTDQIWLYGGERAEIIAQINTPQHGVMPAWTDRLEDTTIKMLTVYVHSLGGGE